MSKKTPIKDKKQKPVPVPITHDELARVGAQWLHRNCHNVVLVDPKTTASDEIPDIIGYKGVTSTLIEVKVSRTDFEVDAKKSHRQVNGKGNIAGMGQIKYFLIPQEVGISFDEIPDEWGYLVYHKGKIKKVKEATKKPFNKDAMSREVPLLLNQLEKVLKYEPTNLFFDHPEVKARRIAGSMVKHPRTKLTRFAIEVEQIATQREQDFGENVSEKYPFLSTLRNLLQGYLRGEVSGIKTQGAIRTLIEDKDSGWGDREIRKEALKVIKWGSGWKTLLTKIGEYPETPYRNAVTELLKKYKSDPEKYKVELYKVNSDLGVTSKT